jgi:hypothetical protein
MEGCSLGLVWDTIPILPGGTKEYHGKNLSQLLPQLRFEPAVSRIEVRSVTASAILLLSDVFRDFFQYP